MNTRKINISFAKSGSGSRTARAVLPIKWTDELGITPENRDVFITLYKNSIIICKEQIIKKNPKEIFELIYNEIKEVIKEEKFITFQRIYSIIEFTMLQYNQNTDYSAVFYKKIIKFLDKHNYLLKKINGKSCYCMIDSSKTNVEKNPN